ncbi:RICIN domain-containing protein [Streptomyces sp. NPDC020362]|uniref:RICIN domain-containing protein n=1 Tax=unclassified Streptomyces TaxID=2593676 RepID=UPI0033CC4E26
MPRADARDSDAELTRRIRSSQGPLPSDVDEMARRHRACVLAYARLCCANGQAEQDLADEAFARTVEAVRAGSGPTEAWRPYLATAVRRVAAHWAANGRSADLTDGYLAWLHGLPQEEGPESAARAAEQASVMLCAFRSLPEHRQTTQWDTVVDTGAPPGPSQEPASAADPKTHAAMAPHPHLDLYEAYLRAYVDRAPSRACRHLAAVIDATVRDGAFRSSDLEHHLAHCADCSSARAELVALHTGDDAAISSALLWPGCCGPAPVGGPAGRSGTGTAPGLPQDEAGRATPVGKYAHGRPRRLLWASYGAALAAALAVAGAVVATFQGDGANDGARRSTTAVAARTTTAGTPSKAASTTATPTGAPTSASTHSRPPRRHPSPTKVAKAATAAPTNKGLTGFQLVNTRSRLCVGIQNASTADHASIQLQDCADDASLRWTRNSADGDTYQLRNVGSGLCLDGTDGGGNVVRVVQSKCRSASDRAAQLWRFTPDTTSSTFRLLFVPQVPSSDYASHLLGPENWPDDDLPHNGSFLAQLPNYYNSTSFVFAMRSGG